MGGGGVVYGLHTPPQKKTIFLIFFYVYMGHYFGLQITIEFN
jgi:hypothetical protein